MNHSEKNSTATQVVRSVNGLCMNIYENVRGRRKFAVQNKCIFLKLDLKNMLNKKTNKQLESFMVCNSDKSCSWFVTQTVVYGL